MESSVHSAYRSAFAEYLGLSDSQVFLYWKGRVAFYALLRAAGIGPGDEVIVPAFTCVVVPNACLYAGAVPVYVDIDPATYNMDVTRVERKITSRTRAIIAQNTFGLSPDMQALQKIADSHGVRLIEDCTHGLGGTFNGQKNGTLAEASFFSTQWNKPYSTGIGGMAVVKNNQLAEEMNRINQQLIPPSFKEEVLLRAQLAVRTNPVMKDLYWIQVKAYRMLTSWGIVVGSSSDEEVESTRMPDGYFKSMADVQAAEGNKRLKNFDFTVRHRAQVAAQYRSLLSGFGLVPPFEPDYAVHGYLKFPILVTDRPAFLKSAESAGIEIGEWFLSPVHPVTHHLERWHYRTGEFPAAEHISRHILNLPTHEGIRGKTMERIMEFLSLQKGMLISQKTPA